MSELQVAKEVFLSIFKWVLWFIIVNNLIWALLFLGIVSSSDVSNNQNLLGENNKQEMTNG